MLNVGDWVANKESLSDQIIFFFWPKAIHTFALLCETHSMMDDLSGLRSRGNEK
jgi:hypothetical protein